MGRGRRRVLTQAHMLHEKKKSLNFPQFLNPPLPLFTQIPSQSDKSQFVQNFAQKVDFFKKVVSTK